MEFYPNGTPKVFRSSLTLIEDGKAVKQKDIIVNDPLRYRGINIFQSSYGELPPENNPQPQASAPGPAEAYSLNFTSSASGMTYTKTAKVGVPVDIPEGLGKFVVTAYEADAKFRGMDVGSALIGIITPAEGEPQQILLPLKFANFDKMRGGEVTIAVANQTQETFTPPKKDEKRYYTGLQVTRDPGVWLVYTGFILMIAGCFVTFYLSHQQVCIVIEPLRKNSRVTFAGVANRNKLAMKNINAKIFTAMIEA
jgi:cytochrome c biogenesis protein